MNFIPSKSIPNGTRFAALYGDGSGARLYLITDRGELVDAEDGPMDEMSPDTWLLDAGFLYWVELPDTYKFWFETAYEKMP